MCRGSEPAGGQCVRRRVPGELGGRWRVFRVVDQSLEEAEQQRASALGVLVFWTTGHGFGIMSLTAAATLYAACIMTPVEAMEWCCRLSFTAVGFSFVTRAVFIFHSTLSSLGSQKEILASLTSSDLEFT